MCVCVCVCAWVKSYILFNTMTQPSESSFYVTLNSRRTQEFPNNSPSHFHYRLPQTLWLSGNWKVGLPSLFLPGAPNPIPHVVTSHTSHSLTVHHETAQRPTKPFSYQSLYISTKAAIPIFYFNNMPKRSATINQKRFCPNSKNRICKMHPMVLSLWAKSFAGWSKI